MKETQERLRQLLDYDPETGIFTRKTRVLKGSPIHPGHLTLGGYLIFSVGSKAQLAHRVAWKWYYGQEPEIIDHINGVKTDNRIANLRSVSLYENNMNTKKVRSGIPIGASYRADKNIYEAQLKYKKVHYYLGNYHSAEEAAAAYWKKRRELGF